MACTGPDRASARRDVAESRVRARRRRRAVGAAEAAVAEIFLRRATARSCSRRSRGCRNTIRPAPSSRSSSDHAAEIGGAHSARRGADRVRQRLDPQGADAARRGAAIAAYVPVDISSEMLLQEAAELRRDYPRLAVLPVEADFTKPFQLPRGDRGHAARRLLSRARPSAISSRTRRRRSCATPAEMLGAGATLIVGVDLVKDAHVLNAAYNDAAGVTARFNLNLLTRINRELGGNFDLDSFEPPRVLQPRAAAHRDASRQPQAPEGAGGRRDASNSAPAKPSTPRTATSTRRSRSARWRAAPAGRRWRRGPIRRAISRCRR